MKKTFVKRIKNNEGYECRLFLIGKEYEVKSGFVAGERQARIGVENLASSHFDRIERDCFEDRGLQWFRHTPGDPMPCDEYKWVDALCSDQVVVRGIGSEFSWRYDGHNMDGDGITIIGWRYADAETSKPEPKTIREHSREEPWTDAYAIDRESDGSFTLRHKVKEPALIWQRAVFHEYPASDASAEMQQADLAAIDDPGHLTQSQRKHIDAMEEKQRAKENMQRAEEAKALQKRADSLNEAGRAMERVKQDHGHRLGWMA